MIDSRMLEILASLVLTSYFVEDKKMNDVINVIKLRKKIEEEAQQKIEPLFSLQLSSQVEQLKMSKRIHTILRVIDMFVVWQ